MRSLVFPFSTLRLQKRLAASVLKCGKKKIWLDPNETNEIANANSRKLQLQISVGQIFFRTKSCVVSAVDFVSTCASKLVKPVTFFSLCVIYI